MASIKQLMTLLTKAGIKEDTRREMIYNYTNGRTQSSKDLSYKELSELCSDLENRLKPAEMELVMKRKRSIVLTIASNCDIKDPNSWEKFNSWMKKSSILKKELHAYNYTEIDDLIKQFRGIEANYSHSAEKAGTKAWHHATGIPKPSFN